MTATGRHALAVDRACEQEEATAATGLALDESAPRALVAIAFPQVQDRLGRADGQAFLDRRPAGSRYATDGRPSLGPSAEMSASRSSCAMAASPPTSVRSACVNDPGRAPRVEVPRVLLGTDREREHSGPGQRVEDGPAPASGPR